jgi:hypothetical protein
VLVLALALALTELRRIVVRLSIAVLLSIAMLLWREVCLKIVVLGEHARGRRTAPLREASSFALTALLMMLLMSKING